jgi:hypothetical protein
LSRTSAKIIKQARKSIEDGYGEGYIESGTEEYVKREVLITLIMLGTVRVTLKGGRPNLIKLACNSL